MNLFTSRNFCLAAAFALACFVVLTPAAGTLAHLGIVGASGLVVGLITVTYTWPATGTTPPTEVQTHFQSQIIATVAGDGVLTSAVIQTNFATTVAELAAGFPLVDFEYLDAYSGDTAKLRVVSKAANTVTVGFPADITSFRVRVNRPYPSIK